MSIAAVPRGLGSLVSPLTGALVALDSRLLCPEDALLHAVWAELPDPLAGGVVRAGGGWSASAAHAAAAAIGESVERAAATAADPQRLVVATAEELGPAALDPARIRLFLPGQLAGSPLVAADRQLRLRWIDGVRLPGLEAVLLPAQLVLLEQQPAGGLEPPLTLPTSNGLACGLDVWSATASALLELVERDAFMLTWATRLSLPQLEWRGVRSLERLEAEHLARTGLRFMAIDLSAFLGVPVVLAVVAPPAGWNGPVAVGAAAARTAVEAVERALAEGHAAFAAARAYVRDRPDAVFAADGSDLASFDDRVRFYGDPARAGALAFLTASPERRHVHDVPALRAETARALVEELAGLLACHGGEAFACDLTPVDLADAGLRVVRCVAPELCQLDAAHAMRFLGVPRLLTGAFDAGLLPRPLRLEEVNPDPHPFP